MFNIDNITFTSPFDLPSEGTKGPVALIDLAPSKEVREFLKNSGRFTYVDHHVPENPDSERAREVYDNFIEISQLVHPLWRVLKKSFFPWLPMWKELRVNKRESSPSCTRLVRTGEFKGIEIYTHNDPDGLLSAMKAIGVTYPEMDKDADVLDGPRSGQTEETLSEYGWLLKRTFSSIPPYNPKNPSEIGKEKIFRLFLSLVRDDSKIARQELETLAESYEASVKESERLLSQQSHEEVPGLWICDVTRSERFELGAISRGLEERGALVTVLIKDFGPIASEFGEQYSIAVKKGESIDLQSLHSEKETNPEMGLISNVPFILHCNEQWWNDLKGKLIVMVREYRDNKILGEGD